MRDAECASGQLIAGSVQVVWSSEYLPFGGVAGHQGTYQFTGFFTGKDYDVDTGLWYYNARWYDASLGRFISEDPAGQGSNWYAYGGNNPLGTLDPSGLWGFNLGFGLDISFDSNHGWGIGIGIGAGISFGNNNQDSIGLGASVDFYQDNTVETGFGAGIDIGVFSFNLGASASWNPNSGWTVSGDISASAYCVGFDFGTTQVWGTNGSYSGGIWNAGLWVGFQQLHVGIGVQYGWGSMALATGGYFDVSALGMSASHNVDTGQNSFGGSVTAVQANFSISSTGVSFGGVSCPLYTELQDAHNFLAQATASAQSDASISGSVYNRNMPGDNASPGEWKNDIVYAGGQLENNNGVISKSGFGAWMVPGDIEEDGSASGGWLIETVTLHVSTEGTKVSVWATDVANTYDFFDLEQSVNAKLKVGNIVIAQTVLSEQAATEILVPEGQRFIGAASLTIPHVFYGSEIMLSTSTTFTVSNENGGYNAGTIVINVPIQTQ